MSWSSEAGRCRSPRTVTVFWCAMERAAGIESTLAGSDVGAASCGIPARTRGRLPGRRRARRIDPARTSRGERSDDDRCAVRSHRVAAIGGRHRACRDRGRRVRDSWPLRPGDQRRAVVRAAAARPDPRVHAAAFAAGDRAGHRAGFRAIPASLAAGCPRHAAGGARRGRRDDRAAAGLRDPRRRLGGDGAAEPRVRLPQRLARRAVHVGRGRVGAPEGSRRICPRRPVAKQLVGIARHAR